MRLVWFAIMLVCGGGVLAQQTQPATAPTTRPATQPSGPKEALRALNLALKRGDANGIKAAFYYRDEDGERLIVAMSEYASALADLHDAAVHAYGPEGANTVTGDMEAQSKEGLAAIDSAEVVEEGASALVRFAGATDPPVRLIRVEGRWKLPLSQLLDGVDAAATERREKELNGQAHLARETAAELFAGKYKEGPAKAAEVWRSRLLASVTPGPATRPSVERHG